MVCLISIIVIDVLHNPNNFYTHTKNIYDFDSYIFDFFLEHEKLQKIYVNSRNFGKFGFPEILPKIKHQKNTLFDFPKTKHFSKTRKTQKLREYRDYQNKIDIHYRFLQQNIEI